jgi:lipooligosaccharide transport system ATP-binding protein
MAKADPIIEAVEVTKKFGSFTAVDKVSLTVRHGEFFGVLGPNGAGKTSIIRMMYGFSPLSAGVMKVFGLDISTGWREIRGQIGVCQQDNTLDPDLSVEKNLLVFAGYYRLAQSVAAHKTRELLNFFALSHKRLAQVSQLSGGMARRLMLARALINDPRLVILDEPTTGLDPQSRHQVWDKLRELRSRGLTMVLTTHYMEEAAHLCDRLIIMDRGRILVEGSPDQLISAYAGKSIIEVSTPRPELVAFVKQQQVRHEELANRLIIYPGANDQLSRMIRERFCHERCVFRNGTLEDVFLHLTGRELRE